MLAFRRPALAMMGALLLSSPLFSGDWNSKKEWLLVNNSTEKFIVTITDWVFTVGSLKIAPADASDKPILSAMVELSKNGSSMGLNPGQKYLAYFDSTAKSLALTFDIATEGKVRSTHFKMRTMVDKMDELTIRTDNLENSPVLVNLAGYMNKDAGAFFTLVDGKKK